MAEDYINKLKEMDRSQLLLEKEKLEKELKDILNLEEKRKGKIVQESPETFFRRFLDKKKIELELQLLQFFIDHPDLNL